MGMCKERAWKLLNDIGFVRVAGTPEELKAAEILKRILSGGVIRFKALFHGNQSRSEIVATFIAVLELCKSRKLSLAGTEDECTLTCTRAENTEPLLDV